MDCWDTLPALKLAMGAGLILLAGVVVLWLVLRGKGLTRLLGRLYAPAQTPAKRAKPVKSNGPSV